MMFVHPHNMLTADKPKQYSTNSSICCGFVGQHAVAVPGDNQVISSEMVKQVIIIIIIIMFV